MAGDFTTPLTVEQVYGDRGIEWEDVVGSQPRPEVSNFDLRTFETVGVGEGDYVLDIGGVT